MEKHKEKHKEKQTINLTEKQLQHILICLKEARNKNPQVENVMVAGENWKYTFVIHLSKGNDKIDFTEALPSIN